MTDLDVKLQELALKDWERFSKLIGEDALTAAKICLLRKENKSYGKIIISLGVTKSVIETSCKKCR